MIHELFQHTIYAKQTVFVYKEVHVVKNKPYQFLISYVQISLKQLTFMAHNNKHAEEYYHIHVILYINQSLLPRWRERKKTHKNGRNWHASST